MNTTQYLGDLRERMQRHKSTVVARASGVHVNTVRAIRNGVGTNHELHTLAKLHDALDAMEGKEND